MQAIVRLFRPLVVLFLFTPTACLALTRVHGLGGCGCCGTFLFLPVAFLALSVALLVWVARDAKARGMDSAILWMLLVFFTNVIGLVIYLLARPQGVTVPCPNCGNQRLQTSVRCPHCGIGS